MPSASCDVLREKKVNRFRKGDRTIFGFVFESRIGPGRDRAHYRLRSVTCFLDRQYAVAADSHIALIASASRAPWTISNDEALDATWLDPKPEPARDSLS